MNQSFRPVNYGAMAYILVILAMVVGFVATFILVSPIVDLLSRTISGLIGSALGIFGL